jgi:large conductance mechanosensitive channel
MLKEFRDFIMKGNVLDLAIAVIIAGAFGTIVTTFTNEILMPPIGMMLGGVDFADMKYVLQPAVMAEDGSVATAEVAIMYGKLINNIINFLIVGFVIFLIVRTYNQKFRAPAPEPAPAGPSAEELLAEIRDLLKKQ